MPSLQTLICLALFRGLSIEAQAGDDPPPPPREFRAVWVATVGNIDWPSRPGLSTAEQKREAVAILDRASRMDLNAIVLQVRPSADAFYESKYEPWSAFLTGTQGKPPEPYYDPLTFWIDEAHRRGLGLHAWFNPYRARYAGAKYQEAPSHVARAFPDLTKPYGGMLWLDPGEPAAFEHTLRVMLDVVRRYDVDGIHFDDYFYPYPIADPATPGRELDFPDGPSWDKYRASGGMLSRSDWRRDNINRLIRRLAEGIKREKPGVLFGISPFGIPRPGKPKGVVGFDQYEKLYADSELWLREGWCDYFAPQLYWKIEAPGQPFRPLLTQWTHTNPKGRHIWPGLSVSRVGDGARGYAPDEIIGQIAILRETPGASGHILFSIKSLMADRREIATRLEREVYRSAALVPESPWLKVAPPGRPRVKITPADGKIDLDVKAGPGPRPFLWMIEVRRDANWTRSIHPAAIPLTIEINGKSDRAVVSAVDRLGNVGPEEVLSLSSR